MYHKPAALVPLVQVRAKVEDIQCRTCRDRLLEAVGKGMARGGLSLTKLVKLAACCAEDGGRRRGEERAGPAGQEGSDADAPAPAPAPIDVLSARGGDESENKAGASAGVETATADRLRIRAPVTPDLLRQVIGVVKVAAAATKAPPPAVEGGGPGDLSAERWLSTYPAPTAALLDGEMSNGVRGTGTGSLAVSRVRSSGVTDSEQSPWALMQRAERAKDNAFRCCGVIEASTRVGLQDPSASNGGSSGAGGGSGGAGGSGGGAAGGGGGSSAMTSNMEWNPQFAPRLQDAEAALVDWLTELTMTLHGLTFQFTLAFVTEEGDEGGGSGGGGGGGNDLAETTALAEDLWTAYEESVKRQLELTLEARRDQLREQAQPMTIALCFAAQNRASAAELLERKRVEMTALHEATVGVMRTAKVQPLLSRAEMARQKWSGLLVAEGFQALDDMVERVLKARLQVFVCVCYGKKPRRFWLFLFMLLCVMFIFLSGFGLWKKRA